MNGYVMTGATADELWPLVRDFHYSRRMSAAIQHCFAVRKPGGLFGDTGEPVAGCIFGLPANPNWPKLALELQRLVRREDYQGQLSQLVSFGLRWIKANTEVPFALSYADTAEGHHGGIYQATNWKYVRLSKGDTGFRSPDGSYHHGRSLVSKYGTRSKDFILAKHPDWVPTQDGDKHLYIYPLGLKWKAIQREYGWQEKPYPKPDRIAPEGDVIAVKPA
jgi:hypothetical protein